MIFCTVFEERKEFFTLRNCTLANRRSSFAAKFHEFMNVFTKIARFIRKEVILVLRLMNFDRTLFRPHFHWNHTIHSASLCLGQE